MSKSIESRFWPKVDKNGPHPDFNPSLGPCWLWTGAITRGYGQFYVSGVGADRRYEGAHRVAYKLVVGPIPEGLTLDHLCRVCRCVNPDHLEPVTVAENVRRGFSPAILAGRSTHCPNGHLYDEVNTYRWRGKRKCRTCRRNVKRRMRERKAAS